METEDIPLLTVTERREGSGGRVLEAEGELDISTVPLLSETLMKACHNPAIWPLTLDLSRVSYIDSYAQGLLVQSFTALHDRGRRLRVVLAPKSQPERILKLSNFEQLLDFIAPAPPPADTPPDEKP